MPSVGTYSHFIFFSISKKVMWALLEKFHENKPISSESPLNVEK